MRRSKSASKMDRFAFLILFGAVCCIANAISAIMFLCILAGATLMFVLRPKESLCLATLALIGGLFRLHPPAGIASLGMVVTLAAIIACIKRRQAAKAVIAIPRLGHGSADR